MPKNEIRIGDWKGAAIAAVLISIPLAIIVPMVFFGFAAGLGLGWFLGNYVQISFGEVKKEEWIIKE